MKTNVIADLPESSSALYAPPEPVPVGSLGEQPPPTLTQRVEPDSPGTPAPGDLLADRYLLKECIRSRGMGRIFKAIDQWQLDADIPSPLVAVKIVRHPASLSGSASRSLFHEARVGQILAHENIIRVFSFDRLGDVSFITMEWLEGKPLSTLLTQKRGAPLTEQQIDTIIKGVCRGMICAHDQGIVHGDIKPANIFITRNSRPKLLDFGAARVADWPVFQTIVSVLGPHTPAYASSEVLEGADVTDSDDLFSFACVIYRMLAGAGPFGNLTAIEAEEAGIEPAPIDNLAPQKWEALRSALAYRRVDRPKNVEAFLNSYFDTAPVKRVEAAAPQMSAPKRSTARDLSFGLAGAAAAAAIILLN